jgi:hypothetical protein
VARNGRVGSDESFGLAAEFHGLFTETAHGVLDVAQRHRPATSPDEHFSWEPTLGAFLSHPERRFQQKKQTTDGGFHAATERRFRVQFPSLSPCNSAANLDTPS